MDADRLTGRLTELAGEHGVPGASVAVLAGGSVTAAATGVLDTRTSVEVTTDSLFQIGSISKVYTATALMREGGVRRVCTAQEPWGGWGSNPRPADYETPAPGTHRC